MHIYNVDEFNKLTVGERSLYNWQFRLHGSFFMALWDAISRADSQNLYHLSRAYPSHIEAYEKYSQESGWWDELVERVGRP